MKRRPMTGDHDHGTLVIGGNSPIGGIEGKTLPASIAAVIGCVMVCLAAGQSAAQATTEAAATPSANAEPVLTQAFVVGNLWLLVGAMLVFVMHLGFACLEAGLTRARNTVNILFKNISIVAIGTLTYAGVGFSLMYGDDLAAGWFAWSGFGIDPGETGQSPAYNDNYPYFTDFIFQAMFAATAATIVSGAVAERIKLESFLIFSTVFVGLVYPVIGFWKWGEGWLDAAGFYDFAGSTLVHAVGGWGALAGALILGPRLGRFEAGHGRAYHGHSMPLAAIGVFLLWFGWFGFNGGSVLSADPASMSLVFVTTMLGACAGVVGAVSLSWFLFRKPDLSMALNGALAGLVSITAGADSITPGSSIIIGVIGGCVVVVGILSLDRLRIDDPVGAIPVHLICGIWGTAAVGIFSTNEDHTLLAQLLGIAAAAALAFPAALAIFFVLKLTIGLRVSPEAERIGLDIDEHGMEAYSGFQIFNTQ
ncbi:MAG: ammonium transporter [Planctomycetota bacterium]